MSSFLLCAPAKGAGALLQAQDRSHQRRDAHAASGREEMLSDTSPPLTAVHTHLLISVLCHHSSRTSLQAIPQEPGQIPAT